MRGRLEQTTARVAVLPARVVYLIAAGSRDGFRRAAQEASCRWAGATELIVPLSKRGPIAPVWKQMVEYGDYDCLVNVDADPGAVDRAKTATGLPAVELEHIDHSGPSRFSIHPVHVGEQEPRTSTAVMATAPRAALWEVAAAGDLTEQHLADVADMGFARRPSTEDQVGRAQLTDDTLLDRGLEQFGEHHARNGVFVSPVVLWITKRNSLKDCIRFWNCRALRPLTFGRMRICLLPHPGLESWSDFPTQVRSVLARPVDIKPDVVVCSLSVGERELRLIAGHLGLKHSTAKLRMGHRSPPPPVRTEPFTYMLNVDVRNLVLFERRYGATVDAAIQVGTPKTLLRVESPVRFTGSGYALLRVSSSAFDHLPKIPSTASMVMRNADWAGDSLQIRTDAQATYHLELTVPDMAETTWAVLRATTSDASLSDKGRLAHRLAEITEESVMGEPRALDFLAALTTPRSKELQRDLNRLVSDGHLDAELAELASTWGGRTQRRHRSVNDLHGIVGSEAYELAELFASEGWAERGFEIRCSGCSIRSFVSVREVGVAPLCPACSSHQQFERSPGLSVIYRLDGLVDRAMDQGIIPHLMASEALATRDSRTHVLLGVDVRFKDGRKAEIDLFGIHGGKTVAGEAKTSPKEFSEAQLRRDVEISQRLNVDVHVMASPVPIGEQLVERARRLIEPTAMDLFVVEGKSVREV